MPRHLTLHIGTPKSGTTHLQAILAGGRPLLRAEGVLYPGAKYLPHDGLNQQAAIYALGHSRIGWVDDRARGNAVKHFERLCNEVAAYRGRVLISAESLCFFDEGEIRRLLSDLRAKPGAVSVVITCRDLGRVIPSVWQQNVKNGTVESLDAYLTSIASLRAAGTEGMWKAFGLPRIVQRWSDVIGQDGVTLVTAPHRDRDALWRRFATAMDVPTSLPEVTGTGTTVDRNASLTPQQVDVLQHLNLVLREQGYPRPRQQSVRGHLLQAWMSAEPTKAAPITLPERFHPMVQAWAKEDVRLLEDRGVRVVGTLDDLHPDLRPSAAPDGGAPDLDQVARDLLLVLEDAYRPRPRVTLRRRVVRAAAYYSKPRLRPAAAEEAGTRPAGRRPGKVHRLRPVADPARARTFLVRAAIVATPVLMCIGS